jgi:ABC-type transport system substrate-binding protein
MPRGGARYPDSGYRADHRAVAGEDLCVVAARQDGVPVMFAGDLVFAGSIGRTDFPGGDGGAMNISLVSSDVSQMARWFWSDNFAPRGSNWGHWQNEEFDANLEKIQELSYEDDREEIDRLLTRNNEILVDDAPWLWIVHDGNGRAMSSNVKGFVSAQSWFQDLTQVSIED